MSKRGTYIVTKSFSTPEVYNTGSSYQQAQIGNKRFRKGEIIKGEIKTANGKPAFLLVGRMTIVPLANIRKLVTQKVTGNSAISSSAEGKDSDTIKKYTQASKVPKIKYLDAILIGGVIGGVGFFAAEKQGLITSTNPKHKLYAAGAGALLAFYAVYRIQQSKVKALKISK
tara:strand:- start:2951 stop:3463 length:513 start_codon:yes stop_codon:yes gene_type:complete